MCKESKTFKGNDKSSIYEEALMVGLKTTDPIVLGFMGGYTRKNFIISLLVIIALSVWFYISGGGLFEVGGFAVMLILSVFSIIILRAKHKVVHNPAFRSYIDNKQIIKK